MTQHKVLAVRLSINGEVNFIAKNQSGVFGRKTEITPLDGSRSGETEDHLFPIRAGAACPSTENVTVFVMPARVRFPVTCSLPGVPVTAVDLNVMVGYFSTSKKLADLRSLSRVSLLVEIEAAGITASNLHFDGSLSSQISVPVIPPKEPRTLLTGTRRIWKSTWVWFLSSARAEACANALALPSKSIETAIVKRQQFIG